MRYTPEEIRALGYQEKYVVPSEVMEIIRSLVTRTIHKTPSKKRDELSELIIIFNNVTADNYEMQYIKLIGLIQTPAVVSTLFFDKVNIKYAIEIYADIYQRLEKKYAAFTVELERRIELHLNALGKLEHVPPADYDAMCDQKEVADRRLTFTKLLVCMRHPALDRLQGEVEGLIRSNLTLQKRNEVDEWVDHLILLKKGNLEWIKEVTVSVVSSRTLFRLQDYAA